MDNIYSECSPKESARFAENSSPSPHRLPRWEESDPHIYGTIKTLINEKNKTAKEKKKIEEKDGIELVDKMKVS